MDVTVSCRHAEITPAQRAAIEAKLSKLTRFLSSVDRAEVHLVEERNRRIANREVCEVFLEGGGHHLRVKTTGPDPMAAVDAAVAKLTHQLESTKSKLVARYHGRAHKPAKIIPEAPAD
jgi:putative sigma-54 modulation protein